MRETRGLTCLACGRSDDGRRGWGGYRTDSEPDDGPQLAFFCPDCAEKELGADESVDSS